MTTSKAVNTRLLLILFSLPLILFQGMSSQPLGADEQRSVDHLSGPGTIWRVSEKEDMSAAVGIPEARRIDITTIDITTEESQSSIDPDSGTLWLTQVPVGHGGTADFQLRLFDVFTPDARLLAMEKGSEMPLPRPSNRLYRGRSLDGGDGSIFLSVDGSGVRAVIWYGGEMTYIWPFAFETGESMQMVLAGDWLPHSNLDNPCSADQLPENLDYLYAFSEGADRFFAASTSDRLEADLMVDVDYGLYSRVFGKSTERVSSYVTNLYGAVSAIFQRDVNVQLRISRLTMWTTPDPFGGENSSVQLLNYRTYMNQNRGGVSRDIGQLLDDQSYAGGAAFEATLCSATYGYSVANLDGKVSFPVTGFVNDVHVVAHELGHNFGSPHTHCYSPPIDKCYGAEPFCYHGPSIPTTGTLMSFCNVTSAGSRLNFHPRVISVIRAGAEAAACLKKVPAGQAPELAVDDGTFEDAIQRRRGGTLYCVNRLTPPSYPATLSEVAIFFPDGTGVNVGDRLTVLVAFNSEGATNIDEASFQPLEGSVQSLGELNLFDVPDLTIFSGDFLVGLKMRHGRRVRPFALDETPPSRRRSYVSTDGVNFDIIDDADPDSTGNLGIRARLN